jgi:hypothetical protein
MKQNARRAATVQQAAFSTRNWCEASPGNRVRSAAETGQVATLPASGVEQRSVLYRRDLESSGGPSRPSRFGGNAERTAAPHSTTHQPKGR